DVGLTPVTVGGPWYVNMLNSESLVPNDVVMVIGTLSPSMPGGLVAVILVLLTTVKLAETLPNFTDVAPEKLEPLMVTTVPPAGGPAEGVMNEMAGIGAYVK